MPKQPIYNLSLIIAERLRGAKKSGALDTQTLTNRVAAYCRRWWGREELYFLRYGFHPLDRFESRYFGWPESDLRVMINHELGQLEAVGMVTRVGGDGDGDKWMLNPSWPHQSDSEDVEFDRNEEVPDRNGNDDGRGGRDGGDDRGGGGGPGNGAGGGPGLGEIIAHPTLFALTREGLEEAVRNAMGGDQ